MAYNPQSQKLVEQLSSNPGTFTAKEIAAQFNVSVDTARGIARRNNLLGHFRADVGNRGRGIIGVGSSLKGEATMVREPTAAELASFEEHCKAHNLPFANWRGFWHKTKEFSSFFVNAEAKKQDEERFKLLIEDIKRHAPKYKKRNVDPTGEHMLVLPQADIHIGKWASVEETGKEYNATIAVERAITGTQHLVAKAQAFGVKNFAVCIGNDILHTDNGKTTTSGTPQDTDGSWFSNFRLARQLYVTIIEQLALYGDVYLIFVPSNHDWLTGFALSETVAAHFVNHPNVHAMVTERHRKYLVFGRNLIMFSHGDGAKEKDLHWLLATEASEAWSRTTHRYIYLGHLHHKIRKVTGHQNGQQEKDKIGFTEIDVSVLADEGRDVNIEYVRSSSGTDGWHAKSGYVSRPAIEAFLHHPVDGQVARFTHWF